MKKIFKRFVSILDYRLNGCNKRNVGICGDCQGVYVQDCDLVPLIKAINALTVDGGTLVKSTDTEYATLPSGHVYVDATTNALSIKP